MGSHVTFEAVFREDGMGKLRHESWSVWDLTLDVLASGQTETPLSLVLCFNDLVFASDPHVWDPHVRQTFMYHL